MVCPPPLTLSPLVQARCNPDYDPSKRPCLLQSFCTTCDSPPASVYSALFVEVRRVAYPRACMYLRPYLLCACPLC